MALSCWQTVLRASGAEGAAGSRDVGLAQVDGGQLGDGLEGAGAVARERGSGALAGEHFTSAQGAGAFAGEEGGGQLLGGDDARWPGGSKAKEVLGGEVAATGGVDGGEPGGQVGVVLAGGGDRFEGGDSREDAVLREGESLGGGDAGAQSGVATGAADGHDRCECNAAEVRLDGGKEGGVAEVGGALDDACSSPETRSKARAKAGEAVSMARTALTRGPGRRGFRGRGRRPR